MQAVRDPADELGPVLLALFLTLALHAVAYAWLAKPFELRLSVPPAKVALSLAEIPSSRLPPSLRLAETSPSGNREAPSVSPFVAARNQSAAQPAPVVGATSPLPRSEGESVDALRLSQAQPRPPLPAVLPPSPPVAEAGTPRVAVTPPAPPRPPSLLVQPNPASGTSGLLLRNPVDVGRAGAISLDARFSTYGDYAQRLLEAVQASWWGILSRTRLDEFAAGTVVIRFRLKSDGTVPEAEVVSSSVPLLATLACKDAVRLPAPYDVWRSDMVSLLGEDETLTITFHYR